VARNGSIPIASGAADDKAGRFEYLPRTNETWKENAMNWVSSEGGPLLLLPVSSLESWGGCTKLSTYESVGAGITTDYDRACQVPSYTGVIRVGTEDALVIGEHAQTTWIPLGANGGMLVQWLYADNEASAVEHASTVPEKLFESAGFPFHVSEKALSLFDSAASGRSLKNERSLAIELTPGTYRVETAEWEPDDHTALVIHRLVRL
jgi:hypothetical protein